MKSRKISEQQSSNPRRQREESKITRWEFLSVQQFSRDVHEAFLVETEARSRPWSPRPRPRPRRWQFKLRRDRDQGLQSSRPRWGRGVPTPRRDRAETLLHLETASRPRRQDRGHAHSCEIVTECWMMRTERLKMMSWLVHKELNQKIRVRFTRWNGKLITKLM